MELLTIDVKEKNYDDVDKKRNIVKTGQQQIINVLMRGLLRKLHHCSHPIKMNDVQRKETYKVTYNSRSYLVLETLYCMSWSCYSSVAATTVIKIFLRVYNLLTYSRNWYTLVLLRLKT